MTSSRLRLAFAGTPKIARHVLESILEKDEHDVVIVFTQPDRPAGRGRKLKPSEVKTAAIDRGIPIQQPATSAEIDLQILAETDLMLVIAYGMLIKPDVLSAPKLGCVNIHTSLLPRWRGAAPIQRAIEAGDETTGISIMQMDEGLDTGPVLMQKSCSIYATDNAGVLHDRLADLSCDTIHTVLSDIASGNAHATEQNNAKACYAPKISKTEAQLNWHEPALVLERKIRAFNPFPVTHAVINDQPMRIWEANIKPAEEGEPGAVMKNSTDSIDVITSDGVLAIKKLQLPGKRVVSAGEFLNGHPDFIN